jgi:hypothetical protein
VFATATLPATANDAPMINTTANLSYTNNDPVSTCIRVTPLITKSTLFSNAPATGVVVTVTVPAGMAYQSNNCGGTEVAVGQFVWPAGVIGFFASCPSLLVVATTTSGGGP